MDLELLTDAADDIALGIGVVGALVVATFVSVKTIGFITAWVRKLFGAAKGNAGG